MNSERLLNVAKALRESPNPEMFDMSIEEHDCGTPACAWGHYFHRTDLQQEFTPTPKHYGEAKHLPSGELVSYQDHRVLEHFDITAEQAASLFSSRGCGRAETPIEAAEWIESFVAKHSGR